LNQVLEVFLNHPAPGTKIITAEDFLPELMARKVLKI